MSLKAESLSGDSVRGSRPKLLFVIETVLAQLRPFSEIPDEEDDDEVVECVSEVVLIDIVVAPDIVELVRECVRVEGAVLPGELAFIAACAFMACMACVAAEFSPLACELILASIWASNRLSSPRITSNSDSCVSSRLAIDMR